MDLFFHLKRHPAHAVFLVLLASAFAMPDAAAGAVTLSTQFFSKYFGWLIMLSCTFFLLFCLYLALSRFGHIVLGKPDEPPEYSFLSWMAMLFAAGMGSGLVFYGAAEPLHHLASPPPELAAASTTAIARRAMGVTYFHWGLHAWAIYALSGLMMGFMAYRYQKPMLPSACILTGPDAGSPPLRRVTGSVINMLAAFAIIFGVVASLGQGITQLYFGFIEQGVTLDGPLTGKIVILVTMALCFTISSLSGISRGIKWLSDINMVIAVGFMAFILFSGPTLFAMNMFVTSTGDYLADLSRLSFNLRYLNDPEGWTQSWTITFLLWWVAWAPFVGVFIARISRGRTLREFVLGVLFIPTVFSFFWFAVLGGTTFHLDMFEQAGMAALAVEDVSKVTYSMLHHLPWTAISAAVLTFLIFIFLVTSADSGTYVLAMFSTDGERSPAVGHRLFWGGVLMLMAGAVLYSAENLAFVRSVAVAGSIPYLFIMLIQSYRFWQVIRRELPVPDRI